MARRYQLGLLVILGLALPVPAEADYASLDGRPRFTYPKTDRIWGPLELSTIEAILRTGPAEVYPRLASAETRDVFLKMVDPGQLASAQDDNAPILQRLIALRTLDGYIGCYRARYNIQARSGEPLENELVRLQAYQLELSAVAIGLMVRLVESLDAEEKARLKQIGFFAGLGTLRTHFAGTVISLSETELYSASARIALAQAIRRSFQGMHRIFSAADREGIAAELTHLASRADSPALRQALLETAEVVATR